MGDIKRQTGRLIQAARKSKGVTQKGLGELLGVSESVVNRYEGGTQNITIQTLQKIANALDVSIHISIDPEK